MIGHKLNLPPACQTEGILYSSEFKEELKYNLDWLKVHLPDSSYIITGWFEETQTYFVDLFGPVIDYVEQRPQKRKEFSTLEETANCIEDICKNICKPEKPAMIKVRFTREFDIKWIGDSEGGEEEEGEEFVEHSTVFYVGDEAELNSIFNETEDTVDWEWEDGTVSTSVPKNCFEICTGELREEFFDEVSWESLERVTSSPEKNELVFRFSDGSTFSITSDSEISFKRG